MPETSEIIEHENEEEQKFEMSPEEATGLDAKPAIFNRKRVLMILCAASAVIICGSMILNMLAPDRNSNAATEQNHAAMRASQQDFLNTLQTRAVHNRQNDPQPEQDLTAIIEELQPVPEPEPLLPSVAFANETGRGHPPPPSRQTPPPAPVSSGSAPPQQRPTHYGSSIVAPIQGRFASQQPTHVQPQQPNHSFAMPVNNPSSSFANRAAVQHQTNADFFDSSARGVNLSGEFIGENSLWIGTIIPAVLQTAIDTALPGNVLARVTQNVFDSQTGRNLLIPQGTVLVAQYNSSVSFAQRRVQIVWNTLIRPDGFHIDLGGGANAVDQTGMSGQLARYHGNWFEYLRAAGIVAMFSIANARMTEEAARHTDDAAASALAQSNQAFVQQMSGNIIDRAMNIQPRLTVDNGTLINIMLNQTLFLPPLPSHPVTQPHRLR